MEDEWKSYDHEERNLRIAIFTEIAKNRRLCDLLYEWHRRENGKHGEKLWKNLFEGWKDTREE